MITALVGAQFGSEGKGLIAGHIAGGYRVHVRVGAANAGHTVCVDGGKHVVQQLPCAAYANPWARVVLGAGALISVGTLMREIETNTEWRKAKDLPRLRLFIDRRAHAVTDEQIAKEQGTDLAERIGSTSATAREGIGTAAAARVMRTDYQLAQNVLAESGPLAALVIEWTDTVKLLHQARTMATSVLLEGTQGTGLSNTIGFYPYVTSRDTTAAALAAQCGLGPLDIDHVLLVARTFPIRVAGNSGPFWPDSRELDWAEVGVPQEQTTVTRKVRRVATFSMEQMCHAVQVNSATEIALTFADYLAPHIAGQSGPTGPQDFDQFDFVGPLVRRIEEQTQTPVTMVGTSPSTVLDREPPPGVPPGLTGGARGAKVIAES